MFQIPGYHERREKAAMEPYIPAEQVLNGCDEDALKALKAFAEGRARTEGDEEGTWKYTRREGRLECELVGLQKRCKKASALLWPDVPEDQRRTDLESVKKELAERLLRSFSDDPNKPPAEHPCRLCDESFENHKALEEHIDAHPEFIQPASRRAEIRARLRSDPLRDLSVSRTTFSWGIPVPDDPKHVM